jgi:flavin reductase (DIM6/NTAB) family NADH-FMN oxidoreductase RutF
MLEDRFLEGMSRAASTVSIVTTEGAAGRAGVTVSAMCSVTAERPALLVCIHQLSPACAAIRANGNFCVNVLRADQSAISETFAGRRPAAGGDKFACASWRRLATGAPALAGGLVAFDCTLMKPVEWGSHCIFIGDVVDVELAEAGRALIYAHRSYGSPRLALDPAAAAATG